MKLPLATALTVAAAALAFPVAAGATTLDLANAPGTSRFDGHALNDEAGTAVSAGDLNGDGRSDVIVGAPLADEGSRHDSGAAYVIYGGGPRLRNLDLGNLGSAGFRIDGAAARDAAGTSVAAVGDVNGDGIADVLVGAPGADDHGRNNSGAAYVVYGQRKADPSNVDLAKITTTQAARGMLIDGATAGDAAGTSVSGGHDLNFDQMSDLMVGAPKADDNGRANAGAAYVLYGGATRDPADVDLARIVTTQGDRGAVFLGAVAGDATGASVAAVADVNDDGIADAIVGAPFADETGGIAYVLYGMNGDDLPDFDLAGIAGSAAGMQIDGAGAADATGQSVAGGRDLNGDGIGDVVVGAPFADNHGRISSGSAYVVYGRPADAPDVDLSKITSTQADRGMRIDGAAQDDRAGTSVAAAGDMSHDNRPDAIVGAPFASNRSRTDSGSAYVLYGQAIPDPPDVDLAKINGTQTARGVRIDGAAKGDLAGFSVAAANVAADKNQEAILGASGVAKHGAFSGAAFDLDLNAGI